MKRGGSGASPLFPLHTVLFPGGPLPLRIFETRYTDMVGRCTREQLPFGVVLIQEGEEAGAASFAATGTARIADFHTLERWPARHQLHRRQHVRMRRVWREADGLNVATSRTCRPIRHSPVRRRVLRARRRRAPRRHRARPGLRARRAPLQRCRMGRIPPRRSAADRDAGQAGAARDDRCARAARSARAPMIRSPGELRLAGLWPRYNASPRITSVQPATSQPVKPSKRLTSHAPGTSPGGKRRGRWSPSIPRPSPCAGPSSPRWRRSGGAPVRAVRRSARAI